jgi:hypothetical protein
LKEGTKNEGHSEILGRIIVKDRKNSVQFYCAIISDSQPENCSREEEENLCCLMSWLCDVVNYYRRKLKNTSKGY